MADDDDPVIASYDVCLTDPLSSTTKDSLSKLLLLQYPAHRESSKPYNAAAGQAPTSLRLKPETGFIEVDVPMVTEQYYNAITGERFGKAMADSRTMHVGGTHGVAGGFATGSVISRLRDIPSHDQPEYPPPTLRTQTLGGKIVAPTPRDPIYLVGCFNQNTLQLSELDGIVQMRPQFHHIDAEDEINQKRFQANNNASMSRQKPGLETAAPKIESKPIEVKMRDTKDDVKDRGLNENARLLREIQMEEWQHHDWIDEDEDDARNAFETYLRLPPGRLQHLPKLQSSLGNGDWLDKMSAPREDGKKGLLAKLRGRERERARRKKAEEEKRQRQKEVTGAASSSHGPLLGMSSDSDPSSPEVSDSDAAEEATASRTNAVETVQIKEEPAAPIPLSQNLGSSIPVAPASAPKKRGRPRKSQADSIPIED